MLVLTLIIPEAARCTKNYMRYAVLGLVRITVVTAFLSGRVAYITSQNNQISDNCEAIVPSAVQLNIRLNHKYLNTK